MNATLPTGRAGTALALGLLGGMLLLLGLGVVAPAITWHAERAEHLAERQGLAARMEAVAATLPALRLAAATPAIGHAAPSLLEGTTDAITGAALQGLVREMAGSVEAAVLSVETLAAAPVGAHRRIGLRLSLAAPWPVLVRLLQAVNQARPRMVVDDLELHNSQIRSDTEHLLLNAAFNLYAFSAGLEPRAAR